MGLFSARSSSARAPRSSAPATVAAKTLDARAQASSLVVFGRIGSNLIAGGLIFLSLATLLALLTQGMFDRRVVLTSPQSTDNYWNDYGQSCRLDANGFVNGSCAESEMATTTPAAWTALGRHLALHWQLTPASDEWFVTTCSVGPPGIQWVFLVFLASSTAHPVCVPTTGAQTIDGIGKLETTNREAYPLGIYELSVLSDAAMMAPSVVHANTDGTSVRLLGGMTQVLVATDGTSMVDDTGINTVVTSQPLGPLYAISTYCQSFFLDMTGEIDTAGWSVGRRSGKVPVVGTNAVTVVANYIGLSMLQGVLSLLTVVLLGGDFVMTFKGLEGALLRKPVLTYDLLSGLEARQLVLLLLTLNAAPSLLYADVARIYYGTPNGNQIWLLSLVMLGNFVAYASLLLLLSVQHVPSPTSRLVPFSTPILLYATTVSVVLCLNPEFATVSNNAFYAGAWNLPLTINGVDRPAGAYDMASVPSAASLLLTHMLYPALVSILASIGLATAHRYVTCRSWSISTTWTATNAFLLATRKPSYLTSLPLGQEAAITIGNKCFCKPSTQAILGYATVTQGTSTKVFAATTTQTETRGGPSSSSVAALPKANAPVALVLSTYQLLPVLLGCLRPRPFGSVAANQFVSTSDSGNSDHATKRFVYSRGFCVN